MIKLITSTGRVGDRTDKKLKGGSILSEAIEEKYGINAQLIGEAFPIANDQWKEALEQANNTLLKVKYTIDQNIQNNHLTLLLSNACALSLGTIPTVITKFPRVKVLWIDAHADFNTPDTSVSGFLSGMVLAGVCGWWDSGHGAGLNPEQALIIGARQFDDLEYDLITRSNIKIMKPKEFSIKEILDFLADDPVWIHIDWDVLEPGYLYEDHPVESGLLPSQIKDTLSMIAKEKILGIELAEFNAVIDESVNQNSIELILDLISPILD